MDYIDLVEPGYIGFGKDQGGSLHFVLIDADVDTERFPLKIAKILLVKMQ